MVEDPALRLPLSHAVLFQATLQKAFDVRHSPLEASVLVRRPGVRGPHHGAYGVLPSAASVPERRVTPTVPGRGNARAALGSHRLRCRFARPQPGTRFSERGALAPSRCGCSLVAVDCLLSGVLVGLERRVLCFRNGELNGKAIASLKLKNNVY